jgi:DNA-binding response OmpR family regulator
MRSRDVIISSQSVPRLSSMVIEAKPEAPVLVVDDDPKIQALVRAYLQREGLAVVTASDGTFALEEIRRSQPQLVVLDLMLPGLDGLSVLRQLRQESDVPVLILSARGSTPDRVYGITEGADDYLPKPFSPAELVARIKAILRRANSDGRQNAEGVLQLNDLTIDLGRQQVLQDGHELNLTSAEFRLLSALVAARGRVLSRQQLQDALYRDAAAGALDRTIDVHVGRLRAKLGDDPGRPRYVATVRGGGYRAVDST